MIDGIVLFVINFIVYGLILILLFEVVSQLRAIRKEAKAQSKALNRIKEIRKRR